jgi:hypothetical protein
VAENTTYISELRDCTEVGLLICALKVRELPTAVAPLIKFYIVEFFSVIAPEAGVKAVTVIALGKAHSNEVV